MYKRTNKHKKNYNKSYSNQKNKDIQGSVTFKSIHTIPELRRVIEITDYDTGEPIHHKLELYKTDRIDCYKVFVDGKLWKERIGWSKILAGIRKALPRLMGE